MSRNARLPFSDILPSLSAGCCSAMHSCHVACETVVAKVISLAFFCLFFNNKTIRYDAENGQLHPDYRHHPFEFGEV